MIKQIISYFFLFVIAIQSIQCLRLFRQKRMPDNGADDLLLSPHMGPDFGNSDAQMIICKNRFDCEDFCRRTTSGLLSSKASAETGGVGPINDSHKVGIQLGRRNDCDKCALIYANCDQKFLSFASKFWVDTKPMSSKAKNDI